MRLVAIEHPGESTEELEVVHSASPRHSCLHHLENSIEVSEVCLWWPSVKLDAVILNIHCESLHQGINNFQMSFHIFLQSKRFI